MGVVEDRSPARATGCATASVGIQPSTLSRYSRMGFGWAGHDRAASRPGRNGSTSRLLACRRDRVLFVSGGYGAQDGPDGLHDDLGCFGRYVVSAVLGDDLTTSWD